MSSNVSSGDGFVFAEVSTLSFDADLGLNFNSAPFGGHPFRWGSMSTNHLGGGSPLKLIARGTSCRSLPKMRVQFMG